MKILNEERSKHGIISNVDEIFNCIQQFDSNDSKNQLSLF